MAELKPCPFCGKHATGTIGLASEMLWDENGGGPYPQHDSFSVLCSAAKPDGPGGCGASGGYFPTEAEAIAAWNRRAPSPAPVAVAGQGEAVREALDRMDNLLDPRFDLLKVGYNSATVQGARNDMSVIRAATTPASPAPHEGAKPVAHYLVVTGEVHEGQETYTVHDKPVPLADNWKLYAAPQEHEARDAARWQPIETAPKCGKKFLAWRRHSTLPLIVFYNEDYDQYESTEGNLVFSLTHWQPLPSAPDAARADTTKQDKS